MTCTSKEKKGNCYLQQLTFYDNFRDSVKVAVLITAKCTIARMIGNFLEGFYSTLLLPSILNIHLCLWFHLQNLLLRESRSIFTDKIKSILYTFNEDQILGINKIQINIPVRIDPSLFDFIQEIAIFIFLYTYKNVMIDVRRKRPKTSLLLSLINSYSLLKRNISSGGKCPVYPIFLCFCDY